MTRAWITAIVAAGTLVVAACNGGDSDADPTTASSTSTATTSPETTEATATTNSPTTSPSTSTSPPSTATASIVSTTTTSAPVAADDWRAIVEQLGRTRQDLYTVPDVSRIGEVCADESQCFRQLDVQLSDLASKGWSVVGADPYTVLDASVESFDGESLETSLLVTVVATVARPDEAGEIVDNGGATVADVEAETEPGFNTQNRTILGRVGPPRNPWRLVSQDRIREVPA